MIVSRSVKVDGASMHYLEQGSGDPILFLHGMPTSSHLWRNIIPYVSPLGRCIAPDLIGMGKSDKPDIQYTVADHIHYIEKFIDALNLRRITLVMHGWGSVIGLDYAMRHEKNCKGLVFYESYLRPVLADDLSLPFLEQVQMLEQGEDAYDYVMNGIDFVDRVLPQGLMTPLPEEEMRHYREPFFPEGAGKPLQQYLHELPRGTGKSPADSIIENYSALLSKSKLPKLLLFSVPGFLTTISTAMWARENLPKLEMIDIGEELHYAQESSPELMGKTISAWLQAVEQTKL